MLIVRIKNLHHEFVQAMPILEKLQAAGFEAYFVGGSVRDAILGRPIHDVDIATSAYPAEVKKVFRKTIDLGIEHGTLLVLAAGGQYEVTTFRTESKYTDYRRPDKVKFVSDLTEDLKRRDFTVNAFAMTKNGEIIDKFAGLADLENKTLRAVGEAAERFNEDALRIMRGMRFAAELNFQIEEETFLAMKGHAVLLPKIAIERIFVELDKLLIASNWRIGLEALNRSEAYKYLPEIGFSDLSDLAADFQFMRSEEAWAWLALQFDNFDIKEWKVSNDFRKTVTAIVSAYHESEWSLENVYHYGLEIAQLSEHLKEGQRQRIAHPQALELDAQLQIHDKSEIVVKGADLIKAGYSPGPELGQLLSVIERQIVNNKLINQKEEILAYVKKLSC